MLVEHKHQASAADLRLWTKAVITVSSIIKLAVYLALSVQTHVSIGSPAIPAVALSLALLGTVVSAAEITFFSTLSLRKTPRPSTKFVAYAFIGLGLLLSPAVFALARATSSAQSIGARGTLGLGIALLVLSLLDALMKTLAILVYNVIRSEWKVPDSYLPIMLAAKGRDEYLDVVYQGSLAEVYQRWVSMHKSRPASQDGLEGGLSKPKLTLSNPDRHTHTKRPNAQPQLRSSATFWTAWHCGSLAFLIILVLCVSFVNVIAVLSGLANRPRRWTWQCSLDIIYPLLFPIWAFLTCVLIRLNVNFRGIFGWLLLGAAVAIFGLSAYVLIDAQRSDADQDLFNERTKVAMIVIDSAALFWAAAAFGAARSYLS